VDMEELMDEHTDEHDMVCTIKTTTTEMGQMNKYAIKDNLSGLDKAIGAVLGQRTIERNQLLVSIAKSKLSKSRDEKNEKVTKPEELVRLYDLLLQILSDVWSLEETEKRKKWHYLKNVKSKPWLFELKG
ncbi:signal recognition particle subunit SRP68, partial [Tanacetum coccineum]